MNDPLEDEQLRSAALENARSILAARKRAEEDRLSAKEALRESEQRLRGIFEQAAVGIAISELDGRIATTNRKFLEILGYEDVGLAGMSAYQITHPEDVDATRSNAERLAAGAIRDYSYEKRYLHRDGRVVWTLTSVGLLRDPEGRPRQFIGVIEDISERKDAQEALRAIAIENQRLSEERARLLEAERAARTEAERMSEIKDEFLATLSHELRTPLSAILGWTQLIGRRPMSREELQQAVQVIERNARAQTRLIEDLLDMSRITSGKVRLDVQPVEPAVFIEAALETVRPAADAKGIRLASLLDPAAGPISGDPGRLQQVVWNLLSNAIKFTPRDGKVQVLLERVNSHIELSVADTGSGIGPEFMPHVFDRFRQADGSTTRRHGGLGLGLAIAQHLVELHGGTIRAVSQGEGRGATFTVHLPLTIVRRSGAQAQRVHPSSAAHSTGAAVPLPDLSGLLVLAVDDERDARELIRQVLQDCGARVSIAASVAEAIALLEHEAPDLVLSDIGMPGTDGFELMRHLRARSGPPIPALALTAFARPEDRTRLLRAGFRMHISKPVESSELCAAVANVAGRTNP